MKEKWTIEIEADVEESERGLWEHMLHRPYIGIYDGPNDNEGLLTVCDDGLHYHGHMNCRLLLDWKLIKRERV